MSETWDFMGAAASPAGLAVLADGAGRIQSISPGTCELLRTSREALLGRALRPMLPRLIGRDAAIEVLSALRDRREWRGQLRLRAPEAGNIALHAQVMRLADVAGRSDWVLGVGHAAASADRAMRANRFDLLGQVAAGVLHDMYNGLGAVRGHAALARVHAEAGRLVALDDSLSNLESGSETCLGMVNRLRDFARGTVAKDDAGVALDEVARAVARLLGPTLDGGVALHVSASGPVLAGGIGLAAALQCALNLAVNARAAVAAVGGRATLSTFVLDDGRLEASCATCERPLTDTGPWAVFECADDGAGLSRDALRAALRPLAARGLEDGGLGLAIVADITHQAGGHLVVESRPGRGSCFRLLLRPRV